MEDALDAFTEAAEGSLGTTGRRTVVRAGLAAVPRVNRLQDKACALLGAWSGVTPDGVRVAGHDLSSDVLVAAAALEITVHGWDVGQALNTRPAIPDQLAERLLPVAGLLVQPEDRAVRFAAPRRLPTRAGPGACLLGFLGRQ